jgi:hypothetical protein
MHCIGLGMQLPVCLNCGELALNLDDRLGRCHSAATNVYEGESKRNIRSR